MNDTLSPEQALADMLPDLMRLARILTRDRDTAEDLAQEALLNVWSRLHRGEEIRDLRPYLMTTLRNAHRRTRHVPVDSAADDELPGVPADAPRRLACREVLLAIAALPAPQAEMMRLLIATGGSYHDLARRSGLPLGTVTSRLSRARKTLRATMSLPAGTPVEALYEEPAAAEMSR